MNDIATPNTSKIWVPYTQMKTAPPQLRVRSAKGMMLELADGRQLMDCISSWWVILHGHGQPEIVAAIADQARELEQVIAAGFTHEPAEALATRLTAKLPGTLNHVFYTDDGSTAVESALKIALQFWRNQGVAGRTRFLSFEEGYHGDTVGAMSVSGANVFNEPFRELLFPCDYLPYPATFLGDTAVEAKEAAALAALDRLLASQAEKYAALIIEPLVQGAGGIRICRPEFLRALAARCRPHGVLVIYDEVMVGFGRIGSWFACLKAGTTPDIVCLSKGITGGFMPLAATVCSEQVFAAFYSDEIGKAFYHGHSYTANPLGCAAGVASFDLLAKNEGRFLAMEDWHRQELAALAGHPRLRNLRVCGTIAAMDVVSDFAPGYLSQVGPIMQARFLERGLLLRPLGNVVYILPPYCITRGQLASVYQAIREVVASL